jgi:hypothetical protein
MKNTYFQVAEFFTMYSVRYSSNIPGNFPQNGINLKHLVHLMFHQCTVCRCTLIYVKLSQIVELVTMYIVTTLFAHPPVNGGCDLCVRACVDIYDIFLFLPSGESEWKNLSRLSFTPLP